MFQWETYESENRVGIGYLIYRGIFMCIFLAILLFTFSCWSLGKEFRFYLIYFTTWTSILTNVYSIIFFARILYAMCKSKCVTPKEETVIPLEIQSTIVIDSYGEPATRISIISLFEVFVLLSILAIFYYYSISCRAGNN